MMTGIILLSLALAHFIQLPERLVSLQFPGLFFTAQVGIQQLAAFLIAMLTISGTDWLLRSHPHLESRSLVEHWLLPGVTTWAIGIPLLQLPISASWWLGFFLGGALLTMVFIAEYIVIDIQDIRRPPAAAGLTAVAFVLYLVLAASLSFADLRLFLFIPPLGLAVFLVSLRTLRLRIPNSWKYHGSRDYHAGNYAAGCSAALLAVVACIVRTYHSGSSLCVNQPVRQYWRR